jgi:hypothetical protein
LTKGRAKMGGLFLQGKKEAATANNQDRYILYRSHSWRSTKTAKDAKKKHKVGW